MIIYKNKKIILKENNIKQKKKLKDFVLKFLYEEFIYYSGNIMQVEDYINYHEPIYEYNNKKYYFDDLPVLKQLEIKQEIDMELNKYHESMFYIDDEDLEFDDYDIYIDFLFDNYGYIRDDKYGKRYCIEIPYTNPNEMNIECDMCGKKYKTKYNTYLKNRLEFNYDLCIDCRGKYGYSMFGKVPSSKQQRYLCKLLNGKLNYKIGNYFADILLPNKKIIIEYDGSGHCVNKNLKEKYISDLKRELDMLKEGYKTIRIISKYDLLPSDKEIIKEINKAIDKLEKGLNRYEIIINKQNFKYLREIKEV